MVGDWPLSLAAEQFNPVDKIQGGYDSFILACCQTISWLHLTLTWRMHISSSISIMSWEAPPLHSERSDASVQCNVFFWMFDCSTIIHSCVWWWLLSCPPALSITGSNPCCPIQTLVSWLIKRSDNFMASLDLKDAYFQFYIHHELGSTSTAFWKE